jgi:hypothetical protein
MNETFLELVTSAKLQASNEMVIPFKGRSRVKQYTKSKPKKWGRGVQSMKRAGCSKHKNLIMLYDTYVQT